MNNTFNILLLVLVMASCSGEERNTSEEPINVDNMVEPISMKRQEAIRLMQLPMECINLEYPNKLNQVIGGPNDLQEPQTLHPAFYGCFDWHSAVHGHWSLVRIINLYPDLDDDHEIMNKLLNHISEENIEQEIKYFENELSQGFERMYGWAWLLKLAQEIHLSDHPKASEIESNLQPLTDLIVDRVMEFLPKLKYPIRVGTHTNTAFAMSLIHDYASTMNNAKLLNTLDVRVREYYLSDVDCPLGWEPSGDDFLSPCLEEAYLMSKVMEKEEYKRWLSEFLPDLINKDFTIAPGEVTDRTDGHLVHLDGLNFSRAWCFYGIARALPEYRHLNKVANEHIEHSLPNITDGNYEGGHWLASFALLSMPYE